MKFSKLTVLTLLGLGVSAIIVRGATVTLKLSTAAGTGTYKVYASSSSGDNAGIAAYDIALTNILTAVHESPRALELGVDVVRGFTVGRLNDDLADHRALFAGQNTTDLPTLIFGIGQTAGNLSMIPIGSDVGVPWSAQVLLISGAYDNGGPEPSFNEAQTDVLIFQNGTGTGNPVAADQITFIYEAIPSVIVDPTFGLETTEAGGTDTFTVVLDTAPTADVTISLTSSDTTEGSVSPASLTFTSANWDIPQTVTVTGVDDGDDDDLAHYSVTTGAASSSDASYNGLTVADVAVANQDDERGVPGVTVSPTSGLITTEAGGEDTFTVSLDAEPTADVTISLSSSDTTEGMVSPASLTFTTLNWESLQTVTVAGVDDSDIDANIAYTIITGDAVSTDVGYSGMTVDDVSVINNNDDVPDVIAPSEIQDLLAVIESPSGKATPAAVSATSQYNPDYGPEKAIDGDGGAIWVSGNQGSAGVTQSITLDLGASKQVEKVRLQAPVSGTAWQYENFPSDFTVDVSTDNATWTTVVIVTGYTPTSGSWYEETFVAQEARYVRFSAATTQVYTYNIYTIRVAEFEAYAVPEEDQVTLTWTSQGDDAGVGTATSYELRYSTSGAIDSEVKWTNATVITGLPAPQVAGSAESFVIPLTSFNSGETVHFNLKTSDEVPNVSLLANHDASVVIP